MTASEVDLAWAAGLFEGEGFLVRRKVGNRVYLQVGIEMRDRDVMERFVAILIAGGVKRTARNCGPKEAAKINTIMRSEKNPLHSDILRWATTGHTGEQAYLLLRPNLASRRRVKGDAILEEAHQTAIDAKRPKVCDYCGGEYVPDDYGQGRRFCTPRCSYE
jgi:hypothetical protein